MLTDRALLPAPVVSLDGTRAVAALWIGDRFEIPDVAATGYHVQAKLRPESEEAWVRLDFSHYLRSTWQRQSQKFTNTFDEALEALVLIGLGDYLDENPVPQQPEPSYMAASIPVDAGVVGARPRPAPAEVQRYIAGKVYWAWRFNIGGTRFSVADTVRLCIDRRELENATRRGEGELWTKSVGEGRWELEATPKLIREMERKNEEDTASRNLPTGRAMGAAPELANLLGELNELAEDVLDASYHVFDNALGRCIAPLQPGGPLAAFVDTVLPEVDFDSWYARARQTIGSMVGSGNLDWPVERPHRVALQLALIRRITSGEVPILDFAVDFLYVSNRSDDNLGAFVQHVFRPFIRDLTRVIEPLVNSPAEAAASRTPPMAPSRVPQIFVDPVRIQALRGVAARDYDLCRLIRMCEELNVAFHNQSYLSVAMLTRAIMDHVPPIFGANAFSELANNQRGARSFRESMQHLSGSARKIGDSYLHVQVRRSEMLPTATQVNFSNDLDTLLAEVVRILS